MGDISSFFDEMHGVIFPYAGYAAPSGFLMCDGSAVSRTTYASLFESITIQTTGTTTNGSESITSVGSTSHMSVGMPISGSGIPAGTTISAIGSGTLTISQNATASASGVALVVAPHGVGDGSTTFNVPDMRGRVAAGADNMNGTAAGRLTSGGSGVNGSLLGAAGGAETVALSAAQMPVHNHGVNDPGHVHAQQAQTLCNVTGSGPGGLAGTGTTLGLSTQTASTGISTQNAGSGSAHNNAQPTLVLNHIIKT